MRFRQKEITKIDFGKIEPTLAILRPAAHTSSRLPADEKKDKVRWEIYYGAKRHFGRFAIRAIYELNGRLIRVLQNAHRLRGQSHGGKP